MMDKDNFSYILELQGAEYEVVMVGGQLTIDGAAYEFNFDDPSYAFAIEVAKLRGLIK